MPPPLHIFFRGEKHGQMTLKLANTKLSYTLPKSLNNIVFRAKESQHPRDIY